MAQPATVSPQTVDLPWGDLPHQQTARRFFASQGGFNPKHDNWRFTPLKNLTHRQWQMASTVPVELDHCMPAGVAVDQALVWVNGQCVFSHGDYADAMTISEHQDEPFIGAADLAWGNAGLAKKALQIVVQKNLTQPLHIVFYAQGNDVVAAPRLVVKANTGIHAELIIHYHGQGRYLHWPSVELDIAEQAHVDVAVAQQDDPQAVHLGALSSKVAKNSRLHLWQFASGQAFMRSEVVGQINGAEAECRYHALNWVGNQQLGDLHIRMDHRHSGGCSDQNILNVVAEKGHGIFEGRVVVAEQASQSQAWQQNRNLLLSPGALVHALPQLEILNDDVECSHGSSTGFLQQDALFYLRSRGIDQATAHQLLVEAFANPFWQSLPWDDFRQRWQQALTTGY